jgi:ligand-binding sensor domain-containing protein
MCDKRLFPPISKTMFLPILLYFALTLATSHRLDAAVGDWKTFTSVRDVRQLICKDSLLWGAANGGVLRYNVLTGSLKKYTNSEGLANNDAVAISMDQRGRVWVALSNGDLNIYSAEQDQWSLKTDYHGYLIQDLLPYGDSVFVSLSIGISLYNSRRWEVKETYKIGDVRRVYIHNREIWAACKDGVRKASLDFPNLIAPGAWTRHTTAQGLQHDETFAVQGFNNQVFVATKAGVSVFDGKQWLATELKNFSITDFALWQDKLLAVTGDGIWAREIGGAWSRLADWINTAQRVGVDGYNTIWLAVRDHGLGYYKKGADKWMFIEPDGPRDNKFSALVFDRNGNLWTASPSAGISRFDGKSWRNFSQLNGRLTANDYRDLAVDNRNRVWAASWGAGVAVFETIQDSIKISYFNSANKRLSGIVGDANYVVVTGVKKDSKGRMWVLNSHAADQRVLVVTDSLDNWQYFSTLEGIRSLYPTALAFDDHDRKWIGLDNAGISVLDDKGTTFDKKDDDLSQGLGSEDELASLHISSLATDTDGLIWIGTPEGLQYWFNGKIKRPNFSIINDNINRVAVDVRNNKWIGTVGGMTVLEADGFTRQHYSTSNSPLVSDFVTCFAFDEKIGYAYIGTTNGLSRLETPYTRPAKDLSLLNGYPNPFLLTGPGAFFYIENLAEKSSLRIYTPEGFLVRHIPQNLILGSRVSWDGRNDRGEYVASGVYVFLVSTEDGQSKAGKIAVVRP